MTDRAVEGEAQVRAWVDIVYAAARRQMRAGSSGEVEDVVQAVFLVMARKGAAEQLPAEKFMAGWLIRVTQYAVKEARRREVRRGFHERRAAMDATDVQKVMLEEEGAAGKLDGALMKLGKVDREVVVRRYLHGEAVREVGAALGMSENTAGRRIGRAVEKLRRVLGAQGVAVPMEVVMGAMGREAGVKAPAGMGGGGSAGAGEIASGVLRSMRMVKVWSGVMVGAAAAVLGVGVAAMGSAGGGGRLAKVAPVVVAAAAPATAEGAETRPEAVLDKAWEEMAGQEPGATRGMLAMMKAREGAAAFLKGKLAPLTISPEEVRKLVGDLGSADDAVWKPAKEKLEYFDPRLAIPITTLMEVVKTEPARRRLVGVLSDHEISDGYGTDPIELRKFKGGMNFATKMAKGGGMSWWAEEKVTRLGENGPTPKKKWAQAGRGIAVLGAIGTPEALAIVNGMTTGNPDAEPTQAAKETLELVAAATTQPAEGKAAMEKWWEAMAKEGQEAWHGELSFAAHPGEAVGFFKTRLVPLKISADEVNELVEKLGSENEAEWKGAEAKMAWFDPRLAVDLKTLMDEAVEPVQNERLVAVLLDAPPGAMEGHMYTLKRFSKENYQLYEDHRAAMGVAWKVSQIDTGVRKAQWRRAARAEVVLGSIGTEEAKGILREMATGNGEAEPTKVAVEELGVGGVVK